MKIFNLTFSAIFVLLASALPAHAQSGPGSDELVCEKAIDDYRLIVRISKIHEDFGHEVQTRAEITKIHSNGKLEERKESSLAIVRAKRGRLLFEDATDPNSLAVRIETLSQGQEHEQFQIAVSLDIFTENEEHYSSIQCVRSQSDGLTPGR